MVEILNREMSTHSDQMCLWGYRNKIGLFSSVGKQIDIMDVN